VFSVWYGLYAICIYKLHEDRQTNRLLGLLMQSGQSGAGTSCCPSTSVSPSPSILRTNFHLNISLSQGPAGEKGELQIKR
jgi:hypothetical protein